jgi:hypothetical protein
MKRGKIGQQLRREAKALLRLSPVVLAALLLVVAFWRSDSAAISGLFQSSPVETPTSTATSPPVQNTATPAETATTMPPGEGTPTAEATLPVPPDTPTTLPLETATTEPSPTPDVGTLTPVPAPETATATPTPPEDPSPTPDERARYPEGDSNLEFEWGMLFDSLSLFLSYAWLCCGVLIFLAVPVLFILLWVASKRRQQPEEED